MGTSKKAEPFNLQPGRKIGRGYSIQRLLGNGTEGEVYQVVETGTDITRAAKLYYPNRKQRNVATVWHARKLHALRHCPIVLQYHHSEELTIKRQKVQCMISELCEGIPLGMYIKQHRGRRITPFQSLVILYQLARGLEAIHLLGEYHADVHVDNIIIHPVGVRPVLKLVDFYDWGRPTRSKQQQDMIDIVGTFYDCLGGRQHYAKQCPEVRHICAGMKHTLILKRFPRMTDLRKHLESFEWESRV